MLANPYPCRNAPVPPPQLTPFAERRSPAMSRRLAWLLATCLLGLVWFGTLDYRKLVKPDEGRYAELAREMALSSDFITPRLNGIKYFEKPPLQYWATAMAFRLFGPDEWTARLWPALTGFLGILFAAFTARRFFGPTAAAYTAAVLASSLLYLLMAQINTLDMGLTFFLTGAVFSFLLAQQGAQHWMLLAWMMLALAVLSKGIVALVLTGGTLVLYSLLTRDFSAWRRLDLLRGSGLFLLIAAPWFIAVSLTNPEFPRFFFIHEHFERFLTTAHRRTAPTWFFVPILLIGALPWTSLTLHALTQAWRQPPSPSPQFQPRRFLLLWCLVVFGFFSLSQSKLPSYILPLFPALALLLGDFLTRIPRRTLLIHLGLIALLAIASLAFTPLIFDRANDTTPIEMMAPYAKVAKLSAALWLTGALTACLLAWSQRPAPAFFMLASASLLAGTGVLLGHENLNRSNSAFYIASQVKSLLPPGVPFYSVQSYDQTLPFYLGRTVTLVQYRDEFSFGQDHEPDKWLPTIEQFRARWLAAGDAFAYMTPEVFDRLHAEGLPMIEVARDTRRIIVRKPLP